MTKNKDPAIEISKAFIMLGTKRIQSHHISYDPEVKVSIYKGEHWILTQLQRRKNFSKGFFKALKVIIALKEDTAKELDKEDD